MPVTRPVLLYGAESWTVRKKEEQILEKTEMRILRRIKGVTLRDKVKSVDIRKELGVNSIQDLCIFIYTHIHTHTHTHTDTHTHTHTRTHVCVCGRARELASAHACA